MSTLVALLRELPGLFVEDGALAFAIVCVISAAAALAALVPHGTLAAGLVLVLGCPGVLLASVLRAPIPGSSPGAGFRRNMR
jgi:hypothetical protein